MQKHTAVEVTSKANPQIAALSKAYGLTPLDRKRLEDGKQIEADESPLEKGMSNAN